MPRRGPAPKPIEQKILEGNPGRRPLNTDSPDYDIDDKLACPKDLTNKASREEWDRLAPMMVEFGTLKKSDLRVFKEYCALVGELDMYQRMAKDNRFPPKLRLRYQDMVIKLRTQFRLVAAELGLTPASRGSVKATRPTGRKNEGNEIKTGTQATPGKGNVSRFFKKGSGGQAS